MARPATVHVRRPARPSAGARTAVAERERAAAFERRLYESFLGLLPGWAIRAVNDPFAFGLSGATPYGSATGTVNDRLAGRDIPIYWNELDLRGYRVLSRQLCDTNQFAIGFTKLLIAFHVRKGYGWQACLKGAKKTPYQTGGAAADPLVEKAQRILDAWRDANCWPLRSREAFRRWARDGEVFGRFFQCGYGRASEFRFVEPEQVGSPTGDTSGDGSFGILNETGDIEKKLAYHLWRMEAPLEGDWVPADRVVHATKNVDRTIKRGVPDFFPVVEDLEGVRRLLHTMVATAIKQARVAWREKFASATADRVPTVPTYANTGTNALQPQNLDDFGRAVREQFGRLGVNGWQAADVVKVEGSREYEPGPVMAGAGGFIQAEQAVLRGCGVLWNFPEYFSGDASNNNLASSLVAGSPFVVTVESSQFEWGAVWERPCALKALELARDAGLLSWEEWSRLDVEVTEPQAATGDPNKDYTTISAQLRDKVICLDTARQKVGVDPQHEAAGVEKDAKAAGPAAAGAPGGAGAGTDAGGGLFERRVRESGPPGPPPRPGLVWNGETHRWKNPETGEEHEHELSDADRDQLASAIERDIAALPEGERPAAGIVAKAKDVALSAAAKLYEWAVNVSTNPHVAKWAPEILEAVFDVPSDMAKFGYNPTSAGGQSNAALGSNDFVRQNLADALGHGVSGHLVASIASKVLVKAAYWVAAKVKGKAAESQGDGLDAWADMMAQLFAHVASELGVDGPMPAADVVEAALRAALGAK